LVLRGLLVARDAGEPEHVRGEQHADDQQPQWAEADEEDQDDRGRDPADLQRAPMAADPVAGCVVLGPAGQ
jgi:hypothetical protein